MPRRKTVGHEEIEHLPPRVGVGLWVLAELHAENHAVRKTHVKRVRAA